MRELLRPLPKYDYAALLVIATIVTMHVFQLIVIFTTINLDGACMYTFWTPSLRPEVSPYWMFVGTAVLISIVVAVWLVDELSNPDVNKPYVVAVGCVLFVALGFWFWRLYSFWHLFLFEANLQKAEYWRAMYLPDIRPFTQCQHRF